AAFPQACANKYRSWSNCRTPTSRKPIALSSGRRSFGRAGLLTSPWSGSPLFDRLTLEGTRARKGHFERHENAFCAGQRVGYEIAALGLEKFDKVDVAAESTVCGDRAIKSLKAGVESRLSRLRIRRDDDPLDNRLMRNRVSAFSGIPAAERRFRH